MYAAFRGIVVVQVMLTLCVAQRLIRSKRSGNKETERNSGIERGSRNYVMIPNSSLLSPSPSFLLSHVSHTAPTVVLMATKQIADYMHHSLFSRVQVWVTAVLLEFANISEVVLLGQNQLCTRFGSSGSRL